MGMQFRMVWRIAGPLLAVGALTWLLVSGVRHNPWVLLEWFVYAGVVLFLVRQPALASLYAALGPRYRILLVTLPAVMIVCQLANIHDRTFPFVRWSMYANSVEDDAVYYEYSVVLSDGREESLPFQAGAHTLRWQIVIDLTRLVRQLENEPNESKRMAAGGRLERALAYHVDRYKKCSSQAVRDVCVWRCSVSLHGRAGGSSIERQRVYAYEVDDPQESREISHRSTPMKHR
jgi:hypothetical protein